MNATTQKYQAKQYPMKMTIPPERAKVPGLVLPNRQWRRNPDGSINVVFNTPDQLRECLDATRACRSKQ